MTFEIRESPGDKMYLLRDRIQGAWITWDTEQYRSLLAFTDGDKAEKYIAEVMWNRACEVVTVHKSQGRDLARRMVAQGVDWMLIDFPPENDQWEWWKVTREVGRNYAMVNLKRLVQKIGRT